MTKPSITMTVRKGVTVVRDGQRIRPEIGKTFDFTAAERDAVLEVDPSALTKPAGEEEGTPTTASTSAPASAEQSQAKASGGKKKATANKSDAENAEDGDGNAPEEANSDDDL